MNKQNGFLNIISVGIVIIMGLLSAALVNMIVSSNEASVKTQAKNRAYDLANAAVEVGLYQLEQTPSICNDTFQATQTVTTGEYRYSCRPYIGTTTLASPLAIGTTASLTLTSSAGSMPLGFAPVGYVVIDSEVIFYNSLSGNVLSGLRRGQLGTTEAAHLVGADVFQSEYVVTGEGGAPGLASPTGFQTIRQAATLTVMMAGSSNGIFTYNGQYWAQTGTLSSTSINGISCTAKDNCWGVGNGGAFYFYNGGSWSTTTVGAPTRNVNSVSCTSASNCVAVGARSGTSAGRAYVYNGSSWSTTDVPRSGGGTGNGDFNTVSCGAANDCFAGNSATDIYPYTGAWGTGSSRSQIVRGLSCANGTRCEGVGINGVAFHLSGSTWSNVTIGNTTDDFTTISCPAATYCVACSPRPSTYTYNGASWSGRIASSVNTVSCLAASNCLGGDTNGQFFSFDGSTWTSITPNPVLSASSITAMSNPILSNTLTRLNVQS